MSRLESRMRPDESSDRLSLELFPGASVLDEEKKNESCEEDDPDGAGQGEVSFGGQVHGLLDVFLEGEGPFQFVSVP